MTLKSKMAAGMTVAAMAVAPMALASGAAAHPGNGHSSKAEQYGKLCQDQSKKHVAGQKGTPFSQCVTAMAKLDKGTTTNPTTACKTESKKHVAGQKGTPYSDCVSAAAKLLEAKTDTTTATS